MEVKFHDIGEGMTEGEIGTFFVKVGDQIGVDEPLLEVQTDKMVAEIPSPTAGEITAIHFKPGDSINVGDTIIEIDDGNESVPPQESVEEESSVKEEPQTEKVNNNSLPKTYKGILAAPYTRKIARELEINIENIEGSGRSGRVTVEDVYALQEGTNATSEEQTQTDTGVEQSVAKADNTKQPASIDRKTETIPFKGIRKQIASNLTHSVQTIPHVTHFDEVDLTNLLAYRKELKEMGEEISVVPFFLKALAVALQDHPLFNAELDEKEGVIRLHRDYNVGLATDTEAGLLVPVLKNISKKSLRELQDEMKELTEKAQQGKLSGKEMQGGTFTISNVGPLGGSWATPIINHPQTGIMAFHKTKKVPVVMDDEEIVIRSIMNISLSFDHRVADGADSVKFANRFIELLEEPKKLFLELT